jgi:replicative DNA helicase
MLYYRLCKTVKDFGTLVEENTSPFLHLTEDVDYYRSIYLYDKDTKNKFDTTNSIKGISEGKTKVLVWDLDSSQIQTSLEDTRLLLNRLIDMGVPKNSIISYFSGNKGFHVEVKLNSYVNVNKFKQITKQISQGISSYDSTICNATRILRIPYTKHNVSGLYKTPLNFDEVFSLDISEIIKLAQEKPNEHTIENFERVVKQIPEVDVSLFDINKEIEPVVNHKIQDTLDLTKKPSWLSNWKYALANGFFPEGTRSNALMILAATYKAQGFQKEITYHALKGAAEMQAKRFKVDKFPKSDIYTTVISQIYSDSWNGGTYSEENFPEILKQFFEDNNIPRSLNVSIKDQLLETVDKGFLDFISYAKESEKHSVQFGIPSIDESLEIRKGHLIGLIAPPGCGKTSLALQILNFMSKQGKHSYFGSYDMYKNNVYQKIIQKHTGLSSKLIYQYATDGNEEMIERFRQSIIENYQNVTFCFRTGQSVSEIKTSIESEEERIGKSIDLVVVDYLELILTEKSDPTAASAEAIQGLREIANSGKVVLILLQPNKISTKPDEPIESYTAAKGSSAIAQAVTAMLTAHRPGYSSSMLNNDKYLSINCVKNRNGALFNVDLAWDGATQSVSELDDSGRAKLSELRALKKFESENNKKGF